MGRGLAWLLVALFGAPPAAEVETRDFAVLVNGKQAGMAYLTVNRQEGGTTKLDGRHGFSPCWVSMQPHDQTTPRSGPSSTIANQSTVTVAELSSKARWFWFQIAIAL